MSFLEDHRKIRVKELQKSIKHTIGLLGWSLKDFVGKYMVDTHDFVEEKDIDQFYETVRKQIERESTSENLLIKYHSFLFATDEYKQLRKMSDSAEFNSYPLKNVSVTAYEPSMNAAKAEESAVLNMAIKHAESMGSCWDFTLIKNELSDKDSIYDYQEPTYLVVYQCDFGFNGGSGCYGVGVIEICSRCSGFGGFYIADKKCEIDVGGARFSHVAGITKGELIVIVKDFDSLDPQANQTLFAKVVLSRKLDDSKVWKVKHKEYIHKDLNLDLEKLESGYT
ncbi:hypothetical protein FM038_003410 [Shewanella eurypsychrophilus]|uniref:PAS domain-containing protein n=1 Tax=Shewanella eurypsychrophilus TaxID=2593656 RepID=A0ABX6V3M6_9GAMM|nr:MULTISPECIES: hypothetical protein [Shewanella]QFU21287.1 hypothetical protein FS418_04990 [Shewanella sp. YLB-09]QPG56578.1 hypothetical protein FM038_003410 [Shewanella eurypsychrophilus]